MKAQRGCRGTTLPFRNVSARWGRVIKVKTRAALPNVREAGVSHSAGLDGCTHGGEEKLIRSFTRGRLLGADGIMILKWISKKNSARRVCLIQVVQVKVYLRTS
jgi:hypothetical protein